MSDSDANSSASKSTKGALIGKPPDRCWAYFSTIAGPPDKDGRPTVQTANKRAHRVCNGCGRTMQSCTVKAATSNLEECGKAKTKYPGMLSAIEQDQMRKVEKKGGGPSRLKRESGSQPTLDESFLPVSNQPERHGIMQALLDMLVMCNIAFRVVDSPWFRRFCRYLRPGCIRASTMRGTYLDDKHTEVKVAIKELLLTVVFPHLITLVLDGWTNMNNVSVWVMIAVLPHIGPVVLETINASAASHTGEWIAGKDHMLALFLHPAGFVPASSWLCSCILDTGLFAPSLMSLGLCACPSKPFKPFKASTVRSMAQIKSYLQICPPEGDIEFKPPEVEQEAKQQRTVDTADVGTLDVTGLTQYKGLNPLPPQAAAGAAAVEVMSEASQDLTDDDEEILPEENEDDTFSPEEMENFFCARHELEEKEAAAARQDQLDVDLHYDIAAAFWEGEYVTVSPEEECQAFGDEPDAGNADLAALIAETSN